MGRASSLLGVELAHGNDAFLELIAGGRGDRGPTAATTKLVVDPSMWLAGAVVGD
jgi:hypothetical protein